MARVLIAGGYGVVGSWIAREMRSSHPEVALVLAGRRPEQGAALAAELGAEVAQLDVAQADAALGEVGPVDLAVASLQDPGSNLAMAALARGGAYTTIACPPETLGALSVAAERGGQAALVLGHWQAGVMSLGALSAAKAFGKVASIELAALYDYADPIGPMTATDAGAFFEKGALIRRDATWTRVDPAAEARRVRRGDAPEFAAQPMSVLDCPTLAAATSAADVRFDLGSGDSLGTLAGHAASHEIYIDLRGEDRSGRPLASRTVLSDPKGQAHLTALGVLIGAERILGLDGRPPLRPGLAFPEAVIEPDAAMRRLQELGVNIESGPLDPDPSRA
jgi:hypothetical protein